MKINWLVRFKNKTFDVSFVAQVIGILAAVVTLGNSAGWWSVQFDSKALTDQLTQAVAVIFTLLGTLGVVQDPTTAGIGDSKQAQTYTEPKKDTAEQTKAEDQTAAAQEQLTEQQAAQDAVKAQTEAPEQK
ncbi:phage holin [Sporolactobacillus shoreicorticis]|uniref:Phage holin n=1 Tax=Sporolactobacillus shoreicorticis TaxID=1923877 RepID=A0ABW5S5Q2_9BACL|nr:phage holin [Sporolactobacillus shoreicorticis]MCO7125629.1 phage holin [Sporolactobacillus shoreicorticis]